MGQQSCCQANQKLDRNTITAQDIENLDFHKLDFNRGSTYKKLETIATEITSQRGISTAYNILISRIIANKQEHLIKILNDIQDNELKNNFITHLETLDFELVDSLFFNLCRHKITEPDENQGNFYSKYQFIQDIDEIKQTNQKNYYQKGLNMIKNEEVGILILAGGKNVRFSEIKNKAICDLGLTSGKSLFQLIAERILKLSMLTNQQTTSKIPIYIMTSDENYFEIKNFWKNNRFFGLDSQNIFFFLQQTLPIMNQHGQVILKNKQKIHLAPNGPGDFFTSLLTFGLLKKICQTQMKFIHVIGVDNLLVKPLDPFLIGYSAEQNQDFICKCVPRVSSDEELPMIILKNNVIKLMDSQDFSREFNDKQNVFSQDAITSPIFMNNIMAKVSYLNELSQDSLKKFKLAQKQLPYYDIETQKMEIPLEDNAYCFEKLLGNILSLTENVKLLQVNREKEFAPILYEKGVNSAEDANLALNQLHKNWLNIKSENNEEIVEISPLVSYDGEGLDKISQEIQNQIEKSQIKFPYYLSENLESFS